MTTSIPFPTMTSSREESSRPERHHHRSFSSDSVPNTNSGFIYVQPKSSSSNNLVGASGISLSKPKRTKIFGFTPTSGEAPFMAKEEQVYSEASTNSTSASFNDTTPPSLIPIPFRPSHLKSSSDFPSPSPSSDYINAIKESFPRSATPMLRKKSGELVRSSLKTGDSNGKERPKTRSAPATPTFTKFVHFDTKLEHVKHFLAQQKPEAVSRSGSPVETETEDEPEAFPFPAMAGAQAGLSLKLPNFPSTIDHTQDAYLESLEIATEGKSLKGIVRVRNLAFEKWVAIRFTLDNWTTVSEVSAEHFQTMSPQSDRFIFHIRLQDLLAKIEEKIMFIAIRYTVGGREIWDNNKGENYHVAFTKIPTPTGSSAPTPPVKRNGWSISNSGQDRKMAELRRELDRLVADDHDSSPLRTIPPFSEAVGPPTVFSSRYDFGTSLKMYTSSAPNVSPPKPKAKILLPVNTNIIPSSSASNTSAIPYNPTSSSNSSSNLPSNYPVPIAPSLYSGYQPSHEVHQRYNTYPVTSVRNLSPPTTYVPLLPPTFVDGRRQQQSPFASPSTSPPRITNIQQHHSHSHHSHQNSYDNNYSSSNTTSNNSSSINSPESINNSSLNSSPPSAGHSNLSSGNGSNSEFSSFLDRYCFHTSATTSSLGLSGPSFENIPYSNPNGPIPSSSSATSSISDFSSTTPRHIPSSLTPTANNTSSSSTTTSSNGYFSTTTNTNLDHSGSSTPSSLRGEDLESLSASLVDAFSKLTRVNTSGTVIGSSTAIVG